MKLTRRKALEICRDLWAWLAETGGDDKDEWPGWAKVGVMANDCPCCEYARGDGDITTDQCERGCPLWGWWGMGTVYVLLGDNIHNSKLCENHMSPYAKWMYARKEWARKKHAARIRDAAIAELAKTKPLKKAAPRKRK